MQIGKEAPRTALAVGPNATASIYRVFVQLRGLIVFEGRGTVEVHNIVLHYSLSVLVFV
jgi:hypothetical protein